MTPLLGRCPRIRAVLDSLECRKTNVRLLRLEPGGLVKEHCDSQLDLGLRNQVRLAASTSWSMTGSRE